MRPRTRRQHKELAEAGLEFRRRKEKEKKTSLRQWEDRQMDRQIDRKEKRWGDRDAQRGGVEGATVRETREKPKWERIKGPTGTRGPPSSTHGPSLSIWASVFRGRRGPGPQFLGGGRSWGSPPQGLLPPRPTPELISGCHLHGEVLVKEI